MHDDVIGFYHMQYWTKSQQPFKLKLNIDLIKCTTSSLSLCLDGLRQKAADVTSTAIVVVKGTNFAHERTQEISHSIWPSCFASSPSSSVSVRLPFDTGDGAKRALILFSLSPFYTKSWLKDTVDKLNSYTINCI